MTDKFAVARLSEMEFPQPNSEVRWAAIRHSLGVSSFGINAWTGGAGVQVIAEHDEAGPRSPQHEELYFVVNGHATFTVEGETVDAPAGTVVLVRDPASKRGAVAVADETTILTVGARPGKVFEPSQWERSLPVLRYFGTKEYEKAHGLLVDMAEETPDDPTVLYNLACAESLLGRTDDAIEHLQQSIANGDSFRDVARNDADFDAIREDPRFAALVG